jgi:hypothetical protein
MDEGGVLRARSACASSGGWHRQRPERGVTARQLRRGHVNKTSVAVLAGGTSVLPVPSHADGSGPTSAIS